MAEAKRKKKKAKPASRTRQSALAPDGGAKLGSSPRHGVPAPQQRTRVTVDLDFADYEALREWSHGARMSHSDVLRALIRVLADDSISSRVRTRQV